MTRRLSPVLFTDEPPSKDDILKLALAMEQQQRATTMTKWFNEGLIAFIEDCDPLFIRVKIEDEVFTDPRDEFPTTAMVARVQLAIAGGRNEHRTPPGGGQQWWADAMEHAYHNVARVTGTVTRKRRTETFIP